MVTATPIADPALHARLEGAVALFRGHQVAVARNAIDALIAKAAAAKPAERDLTLAHASYWAARCARRQDQLDDALRLVYAGLISARRSGQGQVECLLRAELVHVLSTLGLNDDALEQADVAQRRAKHLQNPVGIAAAQEALASVYWMTRDWELGLTAFEAALEQANACGHLELRVLCTMGLAATEEGVAESARDAGRHVEADARVQRSIQLHREAGALASELGDVHLRMYSDLNCGCSLHSANEFEAAKRVFAACLADPAQESVHGNALTMLGRIALDQGDPTTALAHLVNALQVAERANKPYPVLIVLEALVDAHEALGDTASALLFMRRFYALHVKNASNKSRLVARAMSVKYDTERALAVAQAQRQRADQLERSNADLASEAALHERASLEDALTGLANRRRFDMALRAKLGADGVLANCSVALLDIDHFKRVNDQFSHQVGDEVLRRLGALLSKNCRREDLAARYGGEEFVLLGTDVEPAVMLKVCERIRATVEQTDWSAVRPGLQVTVSIGVAHHDEIDGPAAMALDKLLALADSRLYAAKGNGRNQVCGSAS